MLTILYVQCFDYGLQCLPQQRPGRDPHPDGEQVLRVVVQLNPVEVPLLGEAGVHQQFVPPRAVGGAVAAADLAVVVGEGQAPPTGGKGRRTSCMEKKGALLS